jgi:antitoxin YefM
MGLYDNLLCKCPLPDGWVPTGTFQTKDTPAQYLDTYVIREDGTLLHQESGEVVPIHGCIEFYDTNVNAYCPRVGGGHVLTTSDGQPPWRANYEALYDRGKLIRIDGAREMMGKDNWVNPDEWMLASQAWSVHLDAERQREAEGTGGVPASTAAHPRSEGSEINAGNLGEPPMATQTDIQYVTDEKGKPTGVIVPIDLWREIVSETETAHQLKSEPMRRRLLETMRRE